MTTTKHRLIAVPLGRATLLVCSLVGYTTIHVPSQLCENISQQRIMTTTTRRRTEVIDDTAKGLHVTVERGYAADTNWYQTIIDNTTWYRVKYKSNRFGKECETPCWTTFYGGLSDYEPYTPVPSWLQPLVDQVSTDLGVPFNAFLLRLYFDGDDEIAWHTDGRTFLGPTPVIASLSFGATATFQMRRMTNVWPSVHNNQNNGDNGIDHSTPQRDFVVRNGDMLVMRHVTQQHWHHRVPSQKGRKRPRLNINFRRILNSGPDAERGQKTYYKYMVHGDAEAPRAWTFSEIMAKRGGLRNFFQPVALPRAAGKETASDATRSLLQKRTIHKVKNTPTSLRGSLEESDDSMNNECAVYLESEKDVDREVFLSLPIGMREEILSSWKRRQPPTMRSASKAAMNQHSKKRSKSNTHTLEDFFREKK